MSMQAEWPVDLQLRFDALVKRYMECEALLRDARSERDEYADLMGKAHAEKTHSEELKLKALADLDEAVELLRDWLYETDYIDAAVMAKTDTREFLARIDAKKEKP